VLVGTARSTPDLAALADPDTGVWIYNSINNPGKGVFMLLGGTAVATAITAGIANELGLSYSSSKAALTTIYANTGKFKTNHVTDINSGLCGPPGFVTMRAASPHLTTRTMSRQPSASAWCSGWGTLHGTK
jgi:kumamolisin